MVCPESAAIPPYTYLYMSVRHSSPLHTDEAIQALTLCRCSLQHTRGKNGKGCVTEERNKDEA